MRLSFHHANPDGGNESFLLRFSGVADETPCILVDAGQKVDLDPLLKPSDRLVAICLTHAHLDHYAALAAAHRHDAPILTSPATAAVLDDVFEVAGTEYGVETTNAITAAITPVDDWLSVAPDVEIHPVPAGHVPGAIGFLIRAADGDQSHHLLATGDFTQRSAGGFPGLDAESFVDIDVLFLTAATNDDFETSLTDGLATALEHANGGAPTLVTTSGLVGVHIAALLSSLTTEYDLPVPIRAVGHVAKLYEALEYDSEEVETLPYFEHTDECLDPGTITIAGPEVPREQSSGRLFGVLKDNPMACVVQLIGSGADPDTEGQCTIHAADLINHPTRETLEEVHDAVDPVQTVITHRHGGAQGEFNDLNSVVWASGDVDEYTLFSDGRWRLPPWMDGDRVSQRHNRNLQQFAGSDLLASFSVPALDRHDPLTPETEGIDIDRIETLLHRRPTVVLSPDAPDQSDDQPTAANTQLTPTMTTSDDDPTEQTDVPPGLVRTTNPNSNDELDPWLQEALDTGELTEHEIGAAVVAQQRAIEERAEQDSETEAESDSSTAGTLEEGKSETEGTVDDSGASNDGTTTVAPTDGSDEVTTDDTSTTDPETNGTTDSVEDESVSSETSVSEAPSDTTREMDETLSLTDSGCSDNDRNPGDGVELDLNPLAVALADRVIATKGDEVDTNESTAAAIVAAVDRYIIALLSGEASGSKAEQFTVDFQTNEVVEQALTAIIDDDERFESIATLITDSIAARLGTDTDEAQSIAGLSKFESYLNAIMTNDTYVFETTEEIVEAAIAWQL